MRGQVPEANGLRATGGFQLCGAGDPSTDGLFGETLGRVVHRGDVFPLTDVNGRARSVEGHQRKAASALLRIVLGGNPVDAPLVRRAALGVDLDAVAQDGGKLLIEVCGERGGGIALHLPDDGLATLGSNFAPASCGFSGRCAPCGRDG